MISCEPPPMVSTLVERCGGDTVPLPRGYCGGAWVREPPLAALVPELTSGQVFHDFL
jgi:hypothetical protein